MKFLNLKLNNFRNYSSLNIDFSKKINIFYGKNGTGKTNLVESLYFLALTKSFRVNSDIFLRKEGENSFVISSLFENGNYTDEYKVIVEDKEKQLFVNNNKIKTVGDYISNINVILFNPDDLNILKLSPKERRKLLNIEISKTHKEYLLLIVNHSKILKLRNSYLKKMMIDGNASREYLDTLTKKMAEVSLRIIKYREEFIKEIKKHISKIYLNIFGYGSLEIEYKSHFTNMNEEEIFNFYKKNHRNEMRIGKTLYGIQTDDLSFRLDNKNIKEVASTGQMKNAIIAFKLAEAKYLEARYKIKPILILDDLFSELDLQKKEKILKFLDKGNQVFITTTSKNLINDINVKKYKLFEVNEGEVREIVNEKI